MTKPFPALSWPKLGDRRCATSSGLTRFLPATLTGGLDPQVAPVEWHGSGDLASTASANCFLVTPPDRECLHTGEVVTVLLS